MVALHLGDDLLKVGRGEGGCARAHDGEEHFVEGGHLGEQCVDALLGGLAVVEGDQVALELRGGFGVRHIEGALGENRGGLIVGVGVVVEDEGLQGVEVGGQVAVEYLIGFGAVSHGASSVRVVRCHDLNEA